jgi:hypothetical protein
LILPFLNPGPCLRFFRDHPVFLVFSLGIVALTLTGGWDFERYFMMWLSPMVYLSIGLTLEQGLPMLKKWWPVFLLIVSQAASQRLFWLIPEQINNVAHVKVPFVFFTPLGRPLDYLDLLSVTESSGTAGIRLAQYLLACLVFFLVHRHFSKTRNVPSGTIQ